MNTKKRIKLAPVMALTGLLAFTGAQAQNMEDNTRSMGRHNMGEHGMQRGHTGGGMGMHLRGINLTDAQRLEIIELQKSVFGAQDNQREARYEAMQSLIKADKFDEAAAQKLIAARETNRQERDIQRLKFKHGVDKILTPEQRQLRDEYRKSDARGMHGGMKGHKNMGHSMMNRGGHGMMKGHSMNRSARDES